MTLIHAAAVVLWATTLVAAAWPAAAVPLRRLPVLRTPAALVALFSGISLFHHTPADWFTLTGKLRAALVLALVAVDAALEIKRLRRAAAHGAEVPT